MSLLKEILFEEQKEMFDKFYKSDMKVRLVGVKVSGFEDYYCADSLFADSNLKSIKREKIHNAVDVIKDKFGEDLINRGIFAP